MTYSSSKGWILYLSNIMKILSKMKNQMFGNLMFIQIKLVPNFFGIFLMEF